MMLAVQLTGGEIDVLLWGIGIVVSAFCAGGVVWISYVSKTLGELARNMAVIADRLSAWHTDLTDRTDDLDSRLRVVEGRRHEEEG